MYTLKKKNRRILNDIKNKGLYKGERIISSQQSSEIKVGTTTVLNFCANNYLGLSNNSQLIKHAKDALDKYGFGLSSVRFICGTQTIHKELEEKNGITAIKVSIRKNAIKENSTGVKAQLVLKAL